MLNADNSSDSEAGWGGKTDSACTTIGSGGGISLYEPEPSYQHNVQSKGYRSTPDVSFVADPATGAWVADPYNLASSDPFEVLGGTSLSAPASAGLFLLVNQERAHDSEPALDSVGPTENLAACTVSRGRITTRSIKAPTATKPSPANNLVTGLGTPVAGLLVSDLAAYQGPGTTYAGPTVGALQDTTLVPSAAGGGSETDVYNVFDSIPVATGGTALDLDSNPGGAVASFDAL